MDFEEYMNEDQECSFDYEEYLNSSKWRCISDKRKRHDHYECVFCHSKENLNVHHKTYDRLGNEDLKDLITVCKSCHIKIHDYDLQNDKTVIELKSELQDAKQEIEYLRGQLNDLRTDTK